MTLNTRLGRYGGVRKFELTSSTTQNPRQLLCSKYGAWCWDFFFSRPGLLRFIRQIYSGAVELEQVAVNHRLSANGCEDLEKLSG